MENAGQEPELPDCSAPFLISRLLEIGPTVPSGFGPAPLGWRDVEAWQSCSGLRLPPWQARLMIELSREFCSFTKKAEEPDCLAPWSDEAVVVDRRAEVARQLRVGFKSLIAASAK